MQKIGKGCYIFLKLFEPYLIQLKRQMLKMVKYVLQGFKYSLYLAGATTATSLVYLQYINYKIGSIELDKDALVNFYSSSDNQYKMNVNEASNMYYWLWLDISIMRLFTYSSYSSYCEKLNKKILQKNLKNYQEKGVFKELAEIDKGRQKKLLSKILQIRKGNFQNIEDYQFVTKEIRKQQKLMDTRTILHLDPQSIRKLNTVHSFLCKYGEMFKNPQIIAYNKQVPKIQQLFPGDLVHKILFV